jgi:hypothetical protein
MRSVNSWQCFYDTSSAQWKALRYVEGQNLEPRYNLQSSYDYIANEQSLDRFTYSLSSIWVVYYHQYDQVLKWQNSRANNVSFIIQKE